MHNNLINKNIKINRKVFVPTGTTGLLIDSALKQIKKNHLKILDVGCGSGVIGISIYKSLKQKNKIYFSDISRHACKNTLENCKKFKIKCEVRQGDNLVPWKNETFDYIISDIAAISKEISNFTNWYKNCENNSGIDGTKHVIKFIKTVRNNLNKKGSFIFPIISLSNERKILYYLKRNFKNIKKIKSQIWPMPKEIINKEKLLYKLKKKSVINFENKMGILTFKTDIYCVKK